MAELAVAHILKQNARMIDVDPRGYFITGSDTDVGKTYIGCQIVLQLNQRGIAVETRKPAESGCQPGPQGELLTHDAAALQQANGHRENINQICPHRFRAALAPHRAARLEGKQIKLRDLEQACQQTHSEQHLVVEGAGGFYSPLAEDGLNADLASLLQLPVIVVVNDRIGAVNQALMSIAAVEQRHLQIAAIILNQVEKEHEPEMDNLTDLAAHTHLPLFGCGYQSRLPDIFR
ncbi:MAG: dethiobiotin synthase [Pseudomonadota bacterium]